MKDIEKIEKLLHHYDMSGAKFARKCGFNANVITNIRRKRCRMSEHVLGRILCAFPEINMNWLVIGEGEMMNLVVNEETNDNENHQKNRENSSEIIALLKEIVQELKKLNAKR